MHADTTDTDPLDAARAVLRCPDCGAVVAYEWYPGEPHEYGSTIVYEPDYSVAWCPACDWREDD